ncbi:MAG: choice-of-anchor I family protein [Bacteroidota bacterium]
MQRFTLITLLTMFTLGLSAQEVSVEHVSTYATGIFDEGAAEIIDYDAASKKLFSTNADANTVDIIDLSDPSQPILSHSIDVGSFGGGVNSVATKNGWVAIAAEADVKQDPGKILLFDTDGQFLTEFPAGALPDMVAFSPDGNYLLSANEGEPNNEYTVDPEGSVTLVDLSQGLDNATVHQLTFTAFNAQEAALKAEGVRIFGPNASVAQDLEPEFISVTPDNATAYVALQENNALGIVDLNTKSIVAVRALGFKDHSLDRNGFDASDKDDDIEIWPRPTLGMYQPDGIDTYTAAGGQTFVLTANEGDARDYDGYSEEERVDDLDLDPTAYPNADRLQDENNLGRLKTTSANGDTDGDGDVDQIYSYGARSFSIWDASGNQVYDSGNQFAKIIAQRQKANFNDGGGRKKRSDDKGVEPEAVVAFEFNGHQYALIGLERQNGVMIYNIDNPFHPHFVDYFSNRNYDIEDIEDPAAGDVGPEDILFISADDSADGNAYIAVANEVSGTISFFRVFNETERFSLQILHNNDGESALVNAGEGLEFLGGIDRFKTVLDSLRYVDGYLNGIDDVMLSSGDNYLPGPEFNASLALPEDQPLYDALALNAIRYDAICLGNHDFDFGPDILQRLIEDVHAPTTFLSANLNFGNEPGLQALATANRIAPKMVTWRGANQIGIIGLTTPELPLISSPRNVTVADNIVAIVQAQVNELEAMGVNKIILISHLQSINEDIDLAAALRGVDVLIAGGGDELLSNNPADTLPGLPITGPYPLATSDANGETVYIVTTPGEYRYIGNLLVTFDENGKIVSIGEESGPVKVTTNRPSTELTQSIVDPINAYLANLASNVLATTETALDGLRANVRTQETNQGNLIADALLWQANQAAADFGIDAPTVGIQNGGGIRNNNMIAADRPISELTTFDMLPFSNFVSVLDPIPATQFKEVLENAVSRVENVSGRFAQIAGFEMVVDLDGIPQELDADGNVLTEGNRIVSAQLNDGTMIIENGNVVPGAPAISIATVDFLARGGDNYPYRDANFTSVGVTYQQALANYLTDGLGGVISATRYPEGGTGRIQFIANSSAALFRSHDDNVIQTGAHLAYPNPFFDAFELNLDIENDSQVSVALYNAQGQLIKMLFDGTVVAGQHNIAANNLSLLTNGFYFVEITTNQGTQSLTLVKQ